MSPIVLIAGAWHGGWCWRDVAALLRAAGHEVYTPTLTGVSDRAHLLSPSTGLDTHIEDITRLIEFHELNDVVLVGHSYAGQVVTGVADRLSQKISQRIYLDAFVGDDGDAAIDLLPTSVAGHYRDSVEDQGFGWLIPPRSLEVLGVTLAEDLSWLTPRLTPHPWKTYTDRLDLSGSVDTVAASYIECTDWMRVFRPYAKKAAAAGFVTRELATGHEAMVTAPRELANVLIELVDGCATGATTQKGVS
ncbi:alpha/beta hydrolase [Rhodococcus qingshengii]|uniref:alpha/beta hydrolase n=1 Tax=Rhodococcus qingshengii TaxID=334542 RepID=UPI0028F3A808|nr:alpha/beta hydrolase [Rhodococcus qingshengii]MDT9664687.1 alpha/beta hydrolase [Rhodococcus qingshengii]